RHENQGSVSTSHIFLRCADIRKHLVRPGNGLPSSAREAHRATQRPVFNLPSTSRIARLTRCKSLSAGPDLQRLSQGGKPPASCVVRDTMCYGRTLCRVKKEPVP